MYVYTCNSLEVSQTVLTVVWLLWLCEFMVGPILQLLELLFLLLLWSIRQDVKPRGYLSMSGDLHKTVILDVFSQVCNQLIHLTSFSTHKHLILDGKDVSPCSKPSQHSSKDPTENIHLVDRHCQQQIYLHIYLVCGHSMCVFLRSRCSPVSFCFYHSWHNSSLRGGMRGTQYMPKVKQAQWDMPLLCSPRHKSIRHYYFLGSSKW